MGYSGSDDFDVVPTLKILKNIKNIIWLNFVYNDKGEEKIYEIDENVKAQEDKLNINIFMKT